MPAHFSLFNQYRRVGSQISRYYSSAPMQFEPTSTDATVGFADCESINDFKRHWLERRGYYLLDYLYSHLSADDFAAYYRQSSPLSIRRPVGKLDSADVSASL